MRSFLFLCFLVLSGFCSGSEILSESVSASDALKNLKEGNQRFFDERSIRPHQTFERMVRVSKNQKPFVSILSSSDSRVPPEMLFDQGFGDLFVVRVAGNVAGTDQIGTLEYGMGHLGTKLLVVLGHTGCGAVSAVVNEATVRGHVPALVANIIPASKKAKAEGVQGEELIQRTIELNVFQSIEDILTRSAEIRDGVKSQNLMIVGAVYDIKTGRVKWMGEHPDLDQLLKKSGGTGVSEGRAASRGLNQAHPHEETLSELESSLDSSKTKKTSQTAGPE